MTCQTGYCIKGRQPQCFDGQMINTMTCENQTVQTCTYPPNGGCDSRTKCSDSTILYGTKLVQCGPCPSGYYGSGRRGCYDINECTIIQNGGCDLRTTCINRDGGYDCSSCTDVIEYGVHLTGDSRHANGCHPPPPPPPPPPCTSQQVLAATMTIQNINPDATRLPACAKAVLTGAGGVCSLSGHCKPGYTANTLKVTCDQVDGAGNQVATASGTCDPSPCNGVNSHIPHATSGDCPANGNMGSGSRCTPVCDKGYTLDGDKTCNQGTVKKGQCRAVACNATGVGKDKEPPHGRTGEGTCTGAIVSGSSCKPECAAGFSVHGSTNCTLGNITSVGFCVTPKPSLAGCTLQANGTTTKWVCPETGTVTAPMLYLGLVGLFSLGCCGTIKMASAKISKAEYEEGRADWSRVE